MLKRREEYNTYLTHVCKHHHNIKNQWKCKGTFSQNCGCYFYSWWKSQCWLKATYHFTGFSTLQLCLSDRFCFYIYTIKSIEIRKGTVMAESSKSPTVFMYIQALFSSVLHFSCLFIYLIHLPRFSFYKLLQCNENLVIRLTVCRSYVINL